MFVKNFNKESTKKTPAANGRACCTTIIFCKNHNKIQLLNLVIY